MKCIEVECCHCKIVFVHNIKKLERKQSKGHRIYCSKACMGARKTAEAEIKLECKECNIEFLKRRFEVNPGNNFCSSSCACSFNNKLLRSGSNHPNFIHGGGCYSYRNLAFKTQAKQCMNCGFDKEYAIEVHHIDHDRTNNDKSNLIALCCNCHKGVHRGKIILPIAA